MNTFKFFWTTHKWTGIALALVFVITSVTGFLLLFKKRATWIQPPTQRGAEGEVAKWLTVRETWEVVQAQAHPDFRKFSDIARIDVRPGKQVYKVRTDRAATEIQISATTGAVLEVGTRRSDWLERLHDGSFFGAGFHDYVMPIVATGLLFLVFSGLWLWLQPIVKRRRRRRAKGTGAEDLHSTDPI